MLFIIKISNPSLGVDFADVKLCMGGMKITNRGAVFLYDTHQPSIA